MNSPRQLAREAWSEYMDALSRELLSAPVSIEVTGQPDGASVEMERLALQALVYDRGDDVFEVAAAGGGPRLRRVLRHVVDHPCRVAVDTQTMLAPMTISVEGPDGARTVIRVSREQDSDR